MSDLAMKFLLFGEDRSASKALQNVGEESKTTGGHLANMGKMAAVGVAAVATAAVAATAAIVAFGKESVDKFGEAGAETLKLQRYMGGTAEDASRMRSAFHMAGLQVDTAAKSMGIFSKFTSTAGDQLSAYDSKVAAAALKHKQFSGQLGAAASEFAKLGISMKNADGSTRSMKDLLIEFAGQIKDMPNGVDKTTMVLKAFGRGGMEMLPFLNRGAEGVKALMEESDKLGTTLSGKDLAAVKENTIAKRQWGEALEGVQITIGRYLYPTLTKLTEWFTASAIPAIRAVTGWLVDNLGPAFTNIGTFVTSTLLPTLTRLAATFMENVWPALVKVAGMVAENLKPALVELGTYWSGTLQPMLIKAWPNIEKIAVVFGAVVAAVILVVSWLVGKLMPAFTTLSSVVFSLYSDIAQFAADTIDKFTLVVTFVQKMPDIFRTVFSGLADLITTPFRLAFAGIKFMWNNTLGGFKVHVPGIPGTNYGNYDLSIPKLANGGIVSSPTLALIGEAGPEAVVPLSRGGIGGGGDIHIHTNAILTDGRSLAQMVDTAFTEAKRRGWRPTTVGA